MITAEEFEAWKANPITEMVLNHVAGQVEACRTAWMAASWDGGEADPVRLMVLKERARLAQELANIELGDIIDDDAASSD